MYYDEKEGKKGEKKGRKKTLNIVSTEAIDSSCYFAIGDIEGQNGEADM
jgi:hypothetical protein